MHSPTGPVVTAGAPIKKRQTDPLRLCAYLAVFIFSLWMFAREFQFVRTDMHVHAIIASEFNFQDLHSITSRLAYPLWHIFVSVLYQLGVPLIWASAVVCALVKVLGMMLTILLLTHITEERIHSNFITLSGFLLMFITGILVPGFNSGVYRGVGSPTAWHNPTQLLVNVSMLLCVPYIVHCWYDFTRRLPEGGTNTRLPWSRVFVLAVLLMFSLACKPTFMQAFLPACMVFFLVQWIRHPKNSLFFLQLIVAFLPAACYFCLQYLYYTGVVVPFSSGVDFGVSLDSAWGAVRSLLVMTAFPLFVLLCSMKKSLFQDKMLVIALLMTGFSVLESMLFRETGLRFGHGNFQWASMSSSLMLWVLMTGRFLLFYKEFLKKTIKPWYEWVSFGVALSLLGWHIFSGGYYLRYLLVSNNAF
ncbi:MAG: hypothetical protein FWF86_02610 [Clostridia bacterium]|nr:hypothetical protein [Clostridia bacterium]